MPENLDQDLNTLNYEQIWNTPEKYQKLIQLSLINLNNDKNVLNLQTLEFLNAFEALYNRPKLIFQLISKYHGSNHVTVIQNGITNHLNYMLDVLPNTFDLKTIMQKINFKPQFQHQQSIYLKRINKQLNIPMSYMELYHDLKPYRFSLMENATPGYLNTHLNTMRLKLYQDKANQKVFNKIVYRKSTGNNTLKAWLEFNWRLNVIVKQTKNALLNWYQKNRINDENDDVIGFLLMHHQITHAQSQHFFPAD